MSERQVKRIKTGYEPRDWQLEFHQAPHRHKILVFHRRGGKTVGAVSEIIHQAIQFNRMDPLFPSKPLLNPKYAYVATTIGQAERVAWGYFKQYLGHIPGVKFNETKLRITFPHPRGTCTIHLFGTENFDALRGIYLDGYVLDEYADMHPDVRDKVLLATISDRLGWELIIGTVKGVNKFKELYDIAISDPDWYSTLRHAEETGLILPKELEMLKKTMSPEAYRQEYLCDWYATPAGYYYQKWMDEAEKDNRVGRIPYDPAYPVSTWWDLGFHDSGAIWFAQEVNREPRVIRYLENHGKGLDWYVNELKQYPYNYSHHNFPHDGGHHEISTGQTRLEFVENLGLQNCIVHPKTKNVAEGIHRARMLIGKTHFDKVNCELGIKALRSYERIYDAKLQVFKDIPLHNWASHGADAFRLLADAYEVGFGGLMKEKYDNLPDVCDSDYDVFG